MPDMGWKMVRDRTESWAAKHQVSGSWRQATDREAVKALSRKIFEEAGEYLEEHDPGELLDLKDSLDELLPMVVTPDAASAHVAKVKELGTFRDHILWTPVPGEQ